MKTDAAALVDARGLKCPLPVLKVEKLMGGLPPGAELVALATDPMAKVDIPLFCQRHGHECVVTAEGEVLRFSIRKKT
ncbi:MAG: sulfurtransferase TusA family protein [Devosia sp.]|nr:sulfurtransferase TusA family protein [Devosia sp.]